MNRIILLVFAGTLIFFVGYCVMQNQDLQKENNELQSEVDELNHQLSLQAKKEKPLSGKHREVLSDMDWFLWMVDLSKPPDGWVFQDDGIGFFNKSTRLYLNIDNSSQNERSLQMVLWNKYFPEVRIIKSEGVWVVADGSATIESARTVLQIEPE